MRKTTSPRIYQPPPISEPTSKRKAVLEAAYQQNIAAGQPPYQAVKIRTLGELQWIMRRRQWSGHYDNDRPDGLTVGMQRANLRGAILQKVNLIQANLYGAHLDETVLTQTTLIEAILAQATLCRAEMHGANLHRASLEWADLRNAHLSSATLSQVRLIEGTLIGTDLSGADLHRANLTDANLSGADLSNALLNRTEFLRASLCKANLTGADLSGANLNYADLSEANLAGANLCAAVMSFFRGTPHWPYFSQEDWQNLQQEVNSPTTHPFRLNSLAWCWPGVLVQNLIAANPNTLSQTLGSLASVAPAAFLSNPVLPLLFLEDPHWLPREAAQGFLQALTAQTIKLTSEEAAIVSLIKRSAQNDGVHS